MIKLLKLDFKRAIFSRQFTIVVAIGILIAVLHVCIEVLPYYKYYPEGASYFSPFVKWISIDGFSTFALLFFMIFSFLASITYSDSYFIDKNSGFIKNIYTKVNKRDYFLSKYITNFIIGGISVIIPLLINMYLVFMIIPSIKPSIFDSSLGVKEMFSNIYYNNPYIYIYIYVFICFMFGGVFSSIGLAFSIFCKNRFLVITTPTLVYFSMFLLELAGFPQLVPLKFLAANQPVQGINIISISIIFLILFVFSLLVYTIGVKKDEIK